MIAVCLSLTSASDCSSATTTKREKKKKKEEINQLA
jgi:hypothetical protein